MGPSAAARRPHRRARAGLLAACLPSAVAAPAAVGGSSEAFNCTSGAHLWEKGWSDAKKAFCCEHAHVGCDGDGAETSSATAATATRRFDCGSGGYDTGLWRRGWSEAKKKWCCENYEAPLDCEDVLLGAQSAAEGADDATPGSVTTTASTTTETTSLAQVQERYDCREGYAKWETGWSDSKKDWCCRLRMVGCTFDCQADIDEWETRWSDAKRRSCCESAACAELRPTPAPTAGPTTAPTAGPTASPTGRPTPLPTPSPTEADEFDCEAGFSRRETGWSDAKKEWCCRLRMVGCTFDCEADAEGWEGRWSDSKKQYCCQEHGAGCEFDCSEDRAHAEEGWSGEMKRFCCARESVGCTNEDVEQRTLKSSRKPQHLQGRQAVLGYPPVVLAGFSGCLLAVVAAVSALARRRVHEPRGGYRRPAHDLADAG